MRASGCSESIAAKLRIARRARRGRVWVGAKRAVQRSNLKSGGSVDSTFKNFGMAWYQSDLQASSEGKFTTTIRTILLDQIFGFDPDQSNPNPINTFHVGFWFNDPNDAAACGFDVSKPTPFNCEHKAGPVAMISVPDSTTR